MANLIARIKSNANGRNKSSVTTMLLIGESIESATNATGDWTALAWLVALSEGADVGRIKAIVKAVSGITFADDPKQPSGLRCKVPSELKDGNRNSADDTRLGDSLQLLAAYMLRGVGFRSKVLESGVDNLPALLVKRSVDYDLAKRTSSYVSAALKAGVDAADILNAVKAELAKVS